MALAPGSRIGPYEITARIGAGGMGEVWRATDTGLGREVAIKTLPADLAGDPDRLSRFRREAQLLASLNHPNIAAIHGFEEAGGTPILVLELVEGEDLAARLARGPIPPDEAVEIASRIADALEEAHEKGIVHRDLKPANVKLSPDGKVKVLDFGLAKALTAGAPSGPRADLSQSPTLVQPGTQAGVILGTAAYMSPEQARGRVVDRRTDIWAFGAVLWEMLTGRPLFSGPTFSDIVAAVLTRDPDWAALPPATPAHVRRLLRRCLDRDPRRRLQSIGEARVELERGPEAAGESAATGAAAAGAAPSSGRTRRLSWLRTAAIAAAAAALAVAATIALRSTPRAPVATEAPVTFNITMPAGYQFKGGLALSHDGRSLAFAARDPDGQPALWVRDLGAIEPRRVAGTDGARSPFWSPDGRRIGFFAGGELRVIDLIGGAVTSLARTDNAAETRGGTWGAGDVILFAPSFTGPLFRVAAGGGEVTPATRLDPARKDGTHRWPAFLPDGRRFLFYASVSSGTEPGELRLGSIGSDVVQPLTGSHSQAVFHPPHFILYVRGQSLVAHAIDFDRPALVGDPIPLGITLQGSIGISGFRNLTSGGAATMAHRQVLGDVSQLDWVDRAGREIATAAADGGWHNLPRLSPDGSRITVAHFEAGKASGDIHLHDAGRRLDTPLTYDDYDDVLAVWRPDGQELAVTSISSTELGATFLVDPNRPGERRRWGLPTDRNAGIQDWFPDGGLLIGISSENGRSDFYRTPPFPGTELTPLLVTPFSEIAGDLTSDGRWLAYCGDSTGRFEVYARALASGEEWRVSQDGGCNPLWRADGRELFYVDLLGRIVAVPTTLGTGFGMGTPERLFAGRLEDASGRQYDATPDGRRFILNRRKETDERPIIVTIGQPAALRQVGRP